MYSYLLLFILLLRYSVVRIGEWKSEIVWGVSMKILEGNNVLFCYGLLV